MFSSIGLVLQCRAFFAEFIVLLLLILLLNYVIMVRDFEVILSQFKWNEKKNNSKYFSVEDTGLWLIIRHVINRYHYRWQMETTPSVPLFSKGSFPEQVEDKYVSEDWFLSTLADFMRGPRAGPIGQHAGCARVACGPSRASRPVCRPAGLCAGRFVRFWASGGGKFPKMCDSLPWTPMNRRAKFNAASFIRSGEIYNRTKNKQ